MTPELEIALMLATAVAAPIVFAASAWAGWVITERVHTWLKRRKVTR